MPCGNGTLSLTRIQPQGKPAMHVKDFLNGLRSTSVSWVNMKLPLQRLIWVTVGVLLSGMITQAQVRPLELGPGQTKVASVEVDFGSNRPRLHPQSRQRLLQRRMAGTFVYESSTNRHCEQCGIRLRGNTSRNAAKKSFKVSFNTFIAGGKYGTALRK